MEEDCCSTQLIDGYGNFNVTRLEDFVKTVKLAQCGLSYAVVAIIGPQSSGKSTLLNYLFRTNFREMDTFHGRNQTTKGIWIAKAVNVEPCTLVLDLEGTDGRERGEEDTTFEKQSALFALAIADIVLINIWCHDIGREHASNKPLLKTVFQVMMRLFSPRKTTLMFVIRDKTKTPLDYLRTILTEDIQKIWEKVPKPPAHQSTPFSEFFNIEITALPNYETNEEKFIKEVTHLRQRFFHSIFPGGLAGDRRSAIPASGFSYCAQQIWKVIQENKDLDLPSHKVMVATVRCEEIASEIFNRLISDEHWRKLEETTKSTPVSGFGKQLGVLVETYLSQYDMETIYFDEAVRYAKRKELETKLLQHVKSAYIAMLGHLRSKAITNFKTNLEKTLFKGCGFAASVRKCTESCMVEFDRGCTDASVQLTNWDSAKVREKLSQEIETHVCSVCTMKLSELIADYEKWLSHVLDPAIEALLEAGESDSWASIRKLLRNKTEEAIEGFLTDVASFELDESTSEQMVHNLRNYARGIVEKKAGDEAGKVLLHMKDRFFTIFNHDEDSNPRIWTGKEDIKAITKIARRESLRIMSDMAAIRLDEKPDKIKDILFSSLMDTPTDLSFFGRGSGVSIDPLASSNWDQVPPSHTLITPVRCKSFWKQFCAETEYIVSQAISAQEAYKQSNNWLPPPWAIVAMIALGYNEFMMLLRNPVYMLALFLMYILAKALWVQMNIVGEFRHGMLYGLLSLSSKFTTAMMNFVSKLVVESQGQARPEAAQLWSGHKSFFFKDQTCRIPSEQSFTAEPSAISSEHIENVQSTRLEDKGPAVLARSSPT